MNFNKQFFSTRAAWLAPVVVSLFFGSCKLDEDRDPLPPLAYVSIYNASPNAPDLAVLVDDRQINNNPLDYADRTGYLRFYTGDRKIQFGPYDANNVVADTTLTLVDGGAYSIFVADEFPVPAVLVLEDDADQPGQGKALIRFLNLSPDTESVNLQAEGVTNPMFSDQKFKEKSEFTEVDAKRYDFTVVSTLNGNELLNVPGINLQAGWAYTILVRGYTTPPQGNNRMLSAEVLIH